MGMSRPTAGFFWLLPVFLAATPACGPAAGGQGAVEPDGNAGGGADAGPAAGGKPVAVDLSQLPDFTLERHDGMGTVNLHKLAGKKVIALSFWATWCDACQVELPQLQILYEKHMKDGLEILAITMDTAETVSEVPATVEKLGLTFPVLLDTESTVTSAYNPRMSAPLFILIDLSGKQVWSHEGFVVSDVPEVEAQILKALGKE